MYALIDGRVVEVGTGLVAMQHRTSNPTAVKVDGITYSFVAKFNVSLAWVMPQHVDKLLLEQARICCGQSGKRFFLASVINTNLWMTGDRNGN